MDDTIIGVIIGSFVTLVGNFVSHWFTSRREKAQWLRQQEAEEKKWDREEKKSEKERHREEQKSEKEHIRGFYQSSIQSLSALVAAEDEDAKIKLTDEKRLQLVEETHKCITALILRRPDILEESSTLSHFLESFAEKPEQNARWLRNELIELAPKFRELLPKETENVKELVKEEGSREIRLRIDDGFRRQQLVEGVELPQSFSIKSNISKLTPSQRKKLSNIYFDSYKTIPSEVQLYVPIYISHRKQINFTNKEWQASLNPLILNSEEVFKKWELDYDMALEQAQTELARGSTAN